VLEQPVDPGANEFFATVGRGDDAVGHPTWMFIKVPEPKSTKNRVHVDLTADDWTGEVARVVALGATHLADHDEYGVRWATLADPEGNEFDIAAAA
jgi:predicted enzyme related to lactoylglutathione lyase